MIKNTTKTFEEVMNEYKKLGPTMHSVVRNIAVETLQQYGVEEIGSSDVNHQIVSLYNTYDGFDNIVRHGLMDLVNA